MTRDLRQLLQNAPSVLASKKIAAGFDGFIDSIVRVIKAKSAEETVYFQTIKQFGEYIAAKSGSGFSLESEEILLKAGGNMPIMANAMSQMGASANCVGAFGVPAVNPAFLNMHPACELISYTNPGTTTAMEFTDGKIMLAQMTGLNHAGWETIKHEVGIEKLKSVFGEADLVCLVNWSEPDQSNNMWEGLLTDVFETAPQHNSRQFFFDLSDCSKRDAAAVNQAIKLLQRFGNFGKVTLSLNRNEANILRQILIGGAPHEDVQLTGNELFPALNIHQLVIHSAKRSCAWDKNGSYYHTPQFITKPLISTGAGDNFNAGFCIAQLLGLDAQLSLTMADAASHYYISTGKSPGLNAVSTYIS